LLYPVQPAIAVPGTARCFTVHFKHKLYGTKVKTVRQKTNYSDYISKKKYIVVYIYRPPSRILVCCTRYSPLVAVHFKHNAYIGYANSVKDPYSGR
jgi:hypothetical protein